ncbi:unnamed protein product [Amoebophrya sp. A120]|nr:unnamed protein product [Amoebophrya sp. A120]|eukprot:GSA120T00019189001.1
MQAASDAVGLGNLLSGPDEQGSSVDMLQRAKGIKEQHSPVDPSLLPTTDHAHSPLPQRASPLVGPGTASPTSATARAGAQQEEKEAPSVVLTETTTTTTLTSPHPPAPLKPSVDGSVSTPGSSSARTTTSTPPHPPPPILHPGPQGEELQPAVSGPSLPDSSLEKLSQAAEDQGGAPLAGPGLENIVAGNLTNSNTTVERAFFAAVAGRSRGHNFSASTSAPWTSHGALPQAAGAGNVTTTTSSAAPERFAEQQGGEEGASAFLDATQPFRGPPRPTQALRRTNSAPPGFSGIAVQRDAQIDKQTKKFFSSKAWTRVLAADKARRKAQSTIEYGQLRSYVDDKDVAAWHAFQEDKKSPGMTKQWTWIDLFFCPNPRMRQTSRESRHTFVRFSIVDEKDVTDGMEPPFLTVSAEYEPGFGMDLTSFDELQVENGYFFGYGYDGGYRHYNHEKIGNEKFGEHADSFTPQWWTTGVDMKLSVVNDRSRSRLGAYGGHGRSQDLLFEPGLRTRAKNSMVKLINKTVLKRRPLVFWSEYDPVLSWRFVDAEDIMNVVALAAQATGFGWVHEQAGFVDEWKHFANVVMNVWTRPGSPAWWNLSNLKGSGVEPMSRFATPAQRPNGMEVDGTTPKPFWPQQAEHALITEIGEVIRNMWAIYNDWYVKADFAFLNAGLSAERHKKKQRLQELSRIRSKSPKNVKESQELRYDIFQIDVFGYPDLYALYEMLFVELNTKQDGGGDLNLVKLNQAAEAMDAICRASHPKVREVTACWDREVSQARRTHACEISRGIRTWLCKSQDGKGNKNNCVEERMERLKQDDFARTIMERTPLPDWNSNQPQEWWAWPSFMRQLYYCRGRVAPPHAPAVKETPATSQPGNGITKAESISGENLDLTSWSGQEYKKYNFGNPPQKNLFQDLQSKANVPPDHVYAWVKVYVDESSREKQKTMDGYGVRDWVRSANNGPAFEPDVQYFRYVGELQKGKAMSNPFGYHFSYVM